MAPLPSARGKGRRCRAEGAVRPRQARQRAARWTLRRAQRAAGWACPAGRNSRRSTSIRHPRIEAPSPCPAAFARRKGKCRTGVPPPASRRRGLCGGTPHSRPRAARPPWETARTGFIALRFINGHAFVIAESAVLAQSVKRRAVALPAGGLQQCQRKIGHAVRAFFQQQGAGPPAPPPRAGRAAPPPAPGRRGRG